jgi:undecaprenyl phosphate-alpha-L-ara4N flippase subunit ArnE
MLDTRLYPIVGSVLAAVGQIFLKLGASGAVAFTSYLNWRVAVGMSCYVLGALAWLVALSRLPLSRVYPFTILTFVLVYVASVFILGERMTATLLVGVVFVLVGLLIVNFV